MQRVLTLAYQQPTPFVTPVPTQPGATYTVTITFEPIQLITWLIVGLVAGALASALIRGRIGFISSLLIGLIGAFVGGFVVNWLGIRPPAFLATPIQIQWLDIIAAFFGALIVLVIVGSIFRWRRE